MRQTYKVAIRVHKNSNGGNFGLKWKGEEGDNDQQSSTMTENR